MSYDINLFRHTADASSEREKPGASLFTKESRQRCIEIANQLRFKQPTLDWSPVTFGAFEFIDIRDFDHNGNGIEITLSPNDARISIPYWHEREQAHITLLTVWDYLRIMREMTNYDIFDPQLGRLIHLETDLEAVVAAYTESLNVVQMTFK